MKINYLNKNDFLSQLKHSEKFLEQINASQCFLVSQFYPKKEIVSMRNKVFEIGQKSPSSWHPLFDDCPDYHRLHDNYPKAHVKAKMHAFYFHGWYRHNRRMLKYFEEIFQIKAKLGQFDYLKYWSNIPSDKQITRINFHHYPVGGGYQEEHIDPTSRFALIQTIVIASECGKDYDSGGLYIKTGPDSVQYDIDKDTKPGDLLVLSPSIIHGVNPVDSELGYNWNKNTGRWIIMPIIINSDYPHKKNIKPKSIKQS